MIGYNISGKGYSMYQVSDALLDKVIEALQAGDTEARRTGITQSFQIFYDGFRARLLFGRLILIPAKVADSKEDFPSALLYGALMSKLSSEAIADLYNFKLGESEFDEYTAKDMAMIKDKLFKDKEGKYASIVLFIPTWGTPRNYIYFHYTKNAEELKTLVRHQIYGAYYDPALSSAFESMAEDTQKLDVSNITPQVNFPNLTQQNVNDNPFLVPGLEKDLPTGEAVLKPVKPVTTWEVNFPILESADGEDYPGQTKIGAMKVSFVAHVPGHKNSKGEAAPWVVKQHNSGKILSSHKTEAQAKEHLREMEIHKGSSKKKIVLLAKSELKDFHEELLNKEEKSVVNSLVSALLKATGQEVHSGAEAADKTNKTSKRHASGYYKQWGWITPDHKIIDGLESRSYDHNELLEENVKEFKNQEFEKSLPLSKNYVRWFTVNNNGEVTLNIEASNEALAKEAERLLKPTVTYNKVVIDTKNKGKKADVANNPESEKKDDSSESLLKKVSPTPGPEKAEGGKDKPKYEKKSNEIALSQLKKEWTSYVEKFGHVPFSAYMEYACNNPKWTGGSKIAQTVVSTSGNRLDRIGNHFVAFGFNGHSEEIRINGIKAKYASPTRFSGIFKQAVEQYVRNPRNAVRLAADTDWLSLLNNPTSPNRAPVKTTNADVDARINALDLKINKLLGEGNDWSNRKYKSNDKLVTPGGEDSMNSPMRIDDINSKRKKRNVESIRKQVEELQNERNQLLKQRQPEQVNAGETVSIYDNDRNLVAGKVLEVLNDNYMGEVARIKTNEGNYVRRLNEVFTGKTAKVATDSPLLGDKTDPKLGPAKEQSENILPPHVNPKPGPEKNAGALLEDKVNPKPGPNDNPENGGLPFKKTNPKPGPSSPKPGMDLPKVNPTPGPAKAASEVNPNEGTYCLDCLDPFIPCKEHQKKSASCQLCKSALTKQATWSEIAPSVFYHTACQKRLKQAIYARMIPQAVFNEHYPELGKKMAGAFNMFEPGQVIRELEPELLGQIVDYPQDGINFQPPHKTPDFCSQDPGEHQIFQAPSAIGPGQSMAPDVQSGAPLRDPEQLYGWAFEENFYGSDNLKPNVTSMVAAYVLDKKTKTANKAEHINQLREFLKRAAGEIAASFIAAFKVTFKPIMNKVPGTGEIDLSQMEQNVTPITTPGVTNIGNRIKWLLNNINDSEIQEAINASWAQSSVWNSDPNGGFCYEVFVRPSSVDKQTSIMAYEFVIGTKSAVDIQVEVE